jgi:hypothetical protein
MEAEVMVVVAAAMLALDTAVAVTLPETPVEDLGGNRIRHILPSNIPSLLCNPSRISVPFL